MTSKTPARIRIEAGFYSIEALVKAVAKNGLKLDAGTIGRYESGKLHVLQKTTPIYWRVIAKVCNVAPDIYRDAVLNQRQRILKK